MRPSLCEDVLLKLIEGGPAADEPAVREHVKSCLSCFRAASDLRAVPDPQAIQETLPDPGPAFWNAFPRQVVDAWQDRQSQIATSRVRSWFTWPLRFALPAMAAAALLVFVFARSGHRAPARAPVAPQASAQGVFTDDSQTGAEEALDGLEASELRLVAADMAPARGTAEEPEGPSAVEQIEDLNTQQLRMVASAFRLRGDI